MDYQPLILAAGRDDLDIVRMLCDKGADVNTGDKYGRTALMLASERGYLEVVRMLCDKGADVDVQDKYGFNALRCAIYRTELEIVKELCTRGAKVARRSGVFPAQSYLEVIEDRLSRGLVVPESILKSYQINQILATQHFKWNVMVLVGHIQVELLRKVHEWI